MTKLNFILAGVFFAGLAHADPLNDQANTKLVDKLKAFYELTPEATKKLRALFKESDWMGQGKPGKSQHPMSKQQCLDAAAKYREKFGKDPFRSLKPSEAAPIGDALTERERYCGGKHMVPITSKSCIDIFEFPNLPCEYPVVFVSPERAARFCNAMGKRLCDAHEWEGACAGSVQPTSKAYFFDKPGANRDSLASVYNSRNPRTWGYDGKVQTKQYQPGKCGTTSQKSASCYKQISYEGCGVQSWPSGSFLDCRSPFGVFDLHGNVAEHMNFPRKATQLGSYRGGKITDANAGAWGQTEMKGSWFSRGHARIDHCRWRAPDWHLSWARPKMNTLPGPRTSEPTGHSNHHLGFRCCKDVK